jgi:hypothetical protein
MGRKPRAVAKGKALHLTDIQGFMRLSGVDEYGNHYIQFEVDYMAEQEIGECSLCGEKMDSGWLCLDGGDEYCNQCISY